MTAYVLAVISLAAAVAFAVLIVTIPNPGGHRARPRKGLLLRAAEALARQDLWWWLASGEVLLPPAPWVPGPLVTDAEVREEDERLAAERGLCDFHGRYGELGDCTPACPAYAHRQAVPMSPDPAVKPGVGWQVPDDWRLPGGRSLMFVRPGKQPWLTGSMPAVPAPEPTGPDRAWDPGDGLGPQVPIARPWTADQVAYGVDRCQLDVAEAERQFALALGPDGCEEA